MVYSVECQSLNAQGDLAVGRTSYIGLGALVLLSVVDQLLESLQAEIEFSKMTMRKVETTNSCADESVDVNIPSLSESICSILRRESNFKLAQR